MHVQLRFTLAFLKEFCTSPRLIKHAAFVVGMEFDKFIRVHIDVEQICVTPGQRMGYVIIDDSSAVCLFVGFFQLAPVFFLVIDYAKNDLFSVIRLDGTVFPSIIIR